MEKEKGPVQQTVVLYPGVGVGHIGPMTRLAEAFLRHGYAVTMVLIEPPPINSTACGSGSGFFIDHITAANPSITFHVLPPIPLPPPADSGTSSSKSNHPLLLKLELMRLYNDELESFLGSAVPRGRLHSLVIDMFCTHAIDVARKLRVPVYTFFASGAGVLAIFTQLPALLVGGRRPPAGLKELGDTPLEFLGVPPMPASHLVRVLLENPEHEPCRTVMSNWARNTDTHGVLVNTFCSLETRALQAFRDPRCVPGKAALPPVYPIGPLVAGAAGYGESRPECLAWLDAQPERSVVFLCWGSKGSLPEEQIKEIAAGLEKSGQRFLWVVRAPPAVGAGGDPKPPEGFLERTRGRGLVLGSWAPQVDVLNHPAVGAFVTHCGWNSALEAIAAGVPMLCWPLGAEQKMNKVLMAEEMGIGVELQGYSSTGFIKAEEIEAKVRLVLESEEGKELRARAAELKKEAEEALEDGGSSRTEFLRFLSDAENLRGQLGEPQTFDQRFPKWQMVGKAECRV